MSELIQKNDNRATIRWKLLTGVSALALGVCVSSTSVAYAEDASQPLVWIDLGGQLSHLSDSEEAFSPLLMDNRPSIFAPSSKFERPPLYAFEENGKISFRPNDSGWVFSAGIRVGRSASHQSVNQQTNPQPFVKYYYYGSQLRTKTTYKRAAKFADTTSQQSEQHLILDFQAGRDVGLGLFGGNTSSTVSVGVRFAQFQSRSNIVLGSDPDAHPTYKYFNGFKTAHGATLKGLFSGMYHTNAASLEAKRSFHGVGPSLSWNGSSPFAGNPANGEMAIDWGINAALLFGRQRVVGHHHTTSYYHKGKYNSNPRTVSYHTSVPIAQSRLITVPNIGGFAGLSYRYADAKLSLGYRADFFFNAIDGGIDARKSENRAFYGPYASISIGLGD